MVSINKFSVNEGKTKLILFHKSRNNDNLPLQFPNLEFNNYEIERFSLIKRLGFL